MNNKVGFCNNIRKKFIVFKHKLSHRMNKSAYSYRALRMACYNGELDIVKYIVSKGVDMHLDNNCPLVCVSSGGHLDVVKYLHKYGADITADNNRAIYLASYYGYMDIVKFLGLYAN